MDQARAALNLEELRALRSRAYGTPPVASYLIWGSIAVGAVIAAAMTILLAVRSDREPTGSVVTDPAPAPVQGQRASAPADHGARNGLDQELARIHDALRALSADRDRLAARIETLERTLADITSSINREPEPASVAPADQEPKAPTASVPLRPPVPAERKPADHGQDAPRQDAQKQEGQKQDSQKQAAAPAASKERQPPPTNRTEFALDLGADTNVDGLRSRWASIRESHGAVTSGLRPLVSVRQGASPGLVELHLVAGPLPSASAAAQACARLQANGVSCQPTVFEGQRLAPR